MKKWLAAVAIVVGVGLAVVRAESMIEILDSPSSCFYVESIHVYTYTSVGGSVVADFVLYPTDWPVVVTLTDHMTSGQAATVHYAWGEFYSDVAYCGSSWLPLQ